MKSNQDPIVILDQDLKTKKQKVLKPLRFQDFYWSEWRDLNSRPLDPQSQNICRIAVGTGAFLAIDMQ